MNCMEIFYLTYSSTTFPSLLLLLPRGRKWCARGFSCLKYVNCEEHKISLDHKFVSSIIEVNCSHCRPKGALLALKYNVTMGISMERTGYLSLTGYLCRISYWDLEKRLSFQYWGQVETWIEDIYLPLHVCIVRQVALDILRRGDWIKILQTIFPIKNSTLILMQIPSSLKDKFLNDN